MRLPYNFVSPFLWEIALTRFYRIGGMALPNPSMRPLLLHRALTILGAASLLLPSPTAEARDQFDQPSTFDLRSDTASDFFLFDSPFFLSEPGPAWFRNVLWNPAATRIEPITNLSYERDGDRSATYAGWVGTLSGGEPISFSSNSTPFARSSGGSVSAAIPIVPNAPNSTIFWDGGGHSLEWLTAANWNPDTVPGAGDTAYVSLASSNFITINFGGATNNGTANQIVGRIWNDGGNLAIGNGSATHGTLTITGDIQTLTSLSFLNIGGGMTIDLPNDCQIQTNPGGGANHGDVFISGPAVTGAGAINKVGDGNLTLTGNNTRTGATYITGGSLTASGSGSNQALGATSAVTVSGYVSNQVLAPRQAELYQSTSNQINNVAPMTLAAGRYTLDNASEGTTTTVGLGALTLTTSFSPFSPPVSTINLTGTDVLHFDNSSLAIWAAGQTLAIYNWNGTPVTGGGSEQLLFGTDPTGLTPAQLAQIAFYSDSGTNFLGFGGWATSLNGEVVPLAPIPEPSTWIGAALAFGAVAFTLRRRLRRMEGRPLCRPYKRQGA